MKKGNFILASVLLVLGVSIYSESSTFKISDFALDIGPAFYPKLLSILFIICAIILIIQTVKDPSNQKIKFFNKNIIFGIVSVIIYCILFEIIGFVLSSILLMVVIMRILIGHEWKRKFKIMLTFSIGISFSIYYIFHNLLNVSLTWGIFENLLW